MAVVCPTVTAKNTQQYKDQFNKIAATGATRIHLDLGDGVFTPEELISIDQLYIPPNTRADVHVMYQHPFLHIEKLIKLGPKLLIVHAEANGDFQDFSRVARHHKIKTGVALLPETDVETILPSIDETDHVLIFSGNLGYQGGSRADLGLLNKAKRLRAVKPSLEIGWDGGVNDQNIAQLVFGGIDVINVGGYIQNAQDPAKAYSILARIAEETGTT